MPRIAVCAGTFDPITNGHVDIVQRAALLFDEVVVAVAETNYKSTLFSLEDRCRLAETALAAEVAAKKVRVLPFSGLLVDFCKSLGAQVLVRGLRAIPDFDREYQMATLNKTLPHGLDSVFLMSAAEYIYISSSLVRDTAAAGGSISHMVPPCVVAALKQG